MMLISSRFNDVRPRARGVYNKYFVESTNETLLDEFSTNIIHSYMEMYS